MTTRRTAACVAACAFILGFATARAQDAPPASGEDVRAELRELRERLAELEQKHEAERDSDRARISELESELQRLHGESVEAQRLELMQAQIEELRQEIRATTPTPTFAVAQSADASTNLMNPAITVFIDTGGSISSRGENNALNRFNLREAEVDFRAAVAPFADGALVVAIGEEIESERNGDVSISHNVEIEEGFLDFHSLPGDLALKVGKFRTSFGRNNLLHTHDMPTVTRPLAVVSFLGPEGISTVGAGLTWLVPNPWDKYVEWAVQVINSDGGAEAPILGGPNAENPAVVSHIKYFDDVGETSSIELGGSYLWGHTSPQYDYTASVFGVDASYLWVHPDPSLFRSFLAQTEVFWSHNDIDRGYFDSDRNDALGFYVLGQYQFDRDWYGGLRFDYSEFPNSASRGPDDWDVALSPYVSWYITEFLRLRGEYQHRIRHIMGDHSSEEAVFLQFSFVIGSHPPHPYWVHR